MSGIWTNTGAGWALGSPQGFPDERTLHKLIKENPQLLPLAGEPRLAVLGSEVQLGNGYADLLCVESTGRPAIIEVKLASNAEARRAIVAQVIAYAAFLYGADVNYLEQGPLRRQLAALGHGSILEAAQAQDQEGAVDEGSFPASMQECLDRGEFRLVFVLDDAPSELIRMVSYLETITVQALTVDLITVKVYEVNGAQIALPQRVSPDSATITPSSIPVKPKTTRKASEGVDEFRASIQDSTGEARRIFDELIARAEEWAELPKVRLFSYATARPGEYTLLPRIMPDNAGVATIWNDNLRPFIAVWHSVLERRAPDSIEAIEEAMGALNPGRGQWNTTDKITPELMDAITAAYREASESG